MAPAGGLHLDSALAAARSKQSTRLQRTNVLPAGITYIEPFEAVAYVIAIDIFLAGQAWCVGVAAKTYLSGGYLSEDRNNRRLNFSMTTD